MKWCKEEGEEEEEEIMRRRDQRERERESGGEARSLGHDVEVNKAQGE